MPEWRVTVSAASGLEQSEIVEIEGTALDALVEFATAVRDDQRELGLESIGFRAPLSIEIAALDEDEPRGPLVVYRIAGPNG